jgi:hypothetical protein
MAYARRYERSTTQAATYRHHHDIAVAIASRSIRLSKYGLPVVAGHDHQVRVCPGLELVADDQRALSVGERAEDVVLAGGHRAVDRS